MTAKGSGWCGADEVDEALVADPGPRRTTRRASSRCAQRVLRRRSRPSGGTAGSAR